MGNVVAIIYFFHFNPRCFSRFLENKLRERRSLENWRILSVLNYDKRIVLKKFEDKGSISLVFISYLALRHQRNSLMLQLSNQNKRYISISDLTYILTLVEYLQIY